MVLFNGLKVEKLSFYGKRAMRKFHSVLLIEEEKFFIP